ncbi:hypothetical protein LCGC14_0943660 [marine sediment metagenome]|uniref:Uncharacterized protein n=1 Tax=marine sediment metagenome TaxID=412755 RepID=A0A0F9P5E2_9ZZZZ
MNELLFLKIMVIVLWAAIVLLYCFRLRDKFKIKTESIEMGDYEIKIVNGNISINPKKK